MTFQLQTQTALYALGRIELWKSSNYVGHQDKIVVDVQSVKNLDTITVDFTACPSHWTAGGHLFRWLTSCLDMVHCLPSFEPFNDENAELLLSRFETEVILRVSKVY